MKKISAFITIALAALSLASAKEISLGAHGYLGEGWGSAFGLDYEQDYDKKPFVDNLYYGGGIYINFTFWENLGIQPEVNFYVNNIGSDEDVGSYSTHNEYTIKTIDIPVLLTYQFNNFKFLIGPYFSIPVGDINRTIISSNNNDPFVWEDITKGFLFGATAGVEYNVKLGPGSLVVGGRYLHDFNPVKSVYVDEDTGYTETYNFFYRGCAQLILGYQYQF